MCVGTGVNFKTSKNLHHRRMRGNSQQIHGTEWISCVAAIPQRALDSKFVLPSCCLQGGRYIQQCHKIRTAVIWNLQHRSDTLWTCCWKTCKGYLQTTPHRVPSWCLCFGDRPPYLTRLSLPWGQPRWSDPMQHVWIWCYWDQKPI